jgi:hypothetical protein
MRSALATNARLGLPDRLRSVLRRRSVSLHDRGCVKTRDRWIRCERQGKETLCNLIMGIFVDREQSESKSGKLVLCFYTASTPCCSCQRAAIEKVKEGGDLLSTLNVDETGGENEGDAQRST